MGQPYSGRLLSLSTQKLLVAIVFIAIFTMAIRVPVDTDTWWHLRSGQYIVDNLTFFATDPFSHTQLGKLWLYPKLGQVFWYGLFALGSWTGLSLGLATLVTAAFALVWPVTPGNGYIRAFATILGAITSSLIWMARPQIISFLLAGLVLFLLERYKRTGSRKIYSLPLITMLWANLHGGYAIALMLVASYVIGESVNRLTRHSDDPVLSWRQIGILLGVGLVSLGTVALNPYGWKMWVYPFLTVNIGILREAIQEWNSPNFHMPITWPFVVMVLLTLTAMGRAGRRVDWSDLALVGLWGTWSLIAVRNVGLYGLLTVPALARYGDAALGSFLPEGPRTTAGKSSRLLIRLNWLLLAIVGLAALAQISLTLARNGNMVEETNVPAGAVQFIQASKPAGPLFNSYNWGGYLLFKLWPEYPIYIDGRTDLYEDDFIRRYLNVMAAGEGWQQTLDDDGINLVLVEHTSALAKVMLQEPSWQRLYQDELAVVFARQ